MNDVLWKKIWRIKVPQKIKVFMWKLCHNALPDLGNLRKKKLVDCCPICGLEVESIEHTFLLCGWTRGFGSECRSNVYQTGEISQLFMLGLIRN